MGKIRNYSQHEADFVRVVYIQEVDYGGEVEVVGEVRWEVEMCMRGVAAGDVRAWMVAAEGKVGTMNGLLVRAGAEPVLKNDLGETAGDIADQNAAEAAGKALRFLAKSPASGGGH